MTVKRCSDGCWQEGFCDESCREWEARMPLRKRLLERVRYLLHRVGRMAGKIFT